MTTSEQIQLFIEYVKRNISKPLPNSETIAQEIHISRSTLFRLVEKELGMTPFQYIKKVKLEQAKLLFEQGDYQSVRAVAHAVGYTRTDYFIIIYEATFGVNPKDYFQQF